MMIEYTPEFIDAQDLIKLPTGLPTMHNSRNSGNMRKIILASASPRRKELLEKIGLTFEVEPSNYKEDIHTGSEPHEFAREISLQKAEAVAGRYENAIVIAVFFLGRPNIEDPSLADRPKEILTDEAEIDVKAPGSVGGIGDEVIDPELHELSAG